MSDMNDISNMNNISDISNMNDISSDLTTGLIRKNSDEFCLICLSECESRNNALNYYNPECTCIYFIHKECMDEWRAVSLNSKRICILCKTEEVKEIITDEPEELPLVHPASPLPYRHQIDNPEHIIIVHQYPTFDIYSRIVFRLLMMCFLVLIIVIYMVVFIVIKSL